MDVMVILILEKGAILASNTRSFIGLDVVTELAKQTAVDECFQSVASLKERIANISQISTFQKLITGRFI